MGGQWEGGKEKGKKTKGKPLIYFNKYIYTCLKNKSIKNILFFFFIFKPE